MPDSDVHVAVLGTWGYYGLLDDVEEVAVDTPYGSCSDTIVLGKSDGHRVAYLTRTGRHRTIPPHRINARANIWALHSLGVRTILAPTPCGSLRPAIGVGSIVVPDQLVDRTGRTDDTFHDDQDVHLSFGDPFPLAGRRAVVQALRSNGWIVNDGGTLVAIRGPRYSTRAESRWYAAQGWDLVSQTPYPEAALAAELGVSYTCVALVTDHDVIPDTPWPVTQELVSEVLDSKTKRLRQALLQVAVALDSTHAGANSSV
ncbi:MTAP family purine nucleoside phosphorylase [Antrihabitans sp. YC2-6]|uniref:MTAP family purine nucleoside phosphorylase n=1 Tax=Antrihabitans sp. YC2-6 TaxID=2799498 RepID=UPI0018F2A760|nr:MTAP family purine nucleoside phosphorylase [Antrihabitans sp. YC2-6]MBJ8344654.1 MTAP family purine nucleoside phosphorylase [Antrihabitans sp. YC2-6]